MPVDADADLGADDELVLPWYYSWWRVAALTAATTLAVVGLISIATNDRPDSDSVDVGFLQDMRSHHDQAVRMSISFLLKTDADPTLRTIASEILLSQQQETGMMVEVLRGFGAEEENSTGTSMGWMGEPVPTDRMPGMASDDELDRLDAARGAEADELFIALMTAHHEGGVHMAEDAADRAGVERVQNMARAMARVQQEEIDELASISTKLGIDA